MVTFGSLGRYGRFGNQLFQVASTIGIAKANGYDYGFPKWVNHDALDRFGTTEDINVGQWFANELPVYEGIEMAEHYISWGWQGLVHPDNVSYSGHMQSEKYFEHCADDIRDQFKMKGENRKSNYTAVHVRMGDYGGDYHPICSFDYYLQAMARMSGPYLIFSDEILKAKEMLQPLVSSNDYFYTGNTFESFREMKMCRDHIIANSTFSWWAAWLANGNVIAPKRWFGPAADLETKDIYPDKWTVL